MEALKPGDKEAKKAESECSQCFFDYQEIM